MKSEQIVWLVLGGLGILVLIFCFASVAFSETKFFRWLDKRGEYMR